jgi:hypothetical protein
MKRKAFSASQRNKRERERERERDVNTKYRLREKSLSLQEDPKVFLSIHKIDKYGTELTFIHSINIPHE